MKALNNYQVIQNPILGACCIARFVWAYNKKKGVPPTLPLLVLVLPVVFHEKTVAILNRRALNGGLLNAKNEFRDLGVGVQERMEEMLPQSMRAIRSGIQLGMFGYLKATASVHPIGKQVIIPKIPRSIQKMFWTADRLGGWAAESPIEMMCAHLNISF